jgi:hypothetical protein
MGKISVKYALVKDKWNVEIILPAALSGRFVWKGQEGPLAGGVNKFVL